MRIRFHLATAITLLFCPAVLGQAPSGAIIQGTVTFAGNGEPLHGASVLLSPGGRIVESDDLGRYRFEGLAPGEYTLLAHVHALADEKKTVRVQAGETATVDFALRISPLKESLTVTASGREESAADAFLSVVSLDGYQLTGRSASSSLGDLLGDEAGVAKRSYGPGSTRPVIRGFDGDRVLVLQDGMRTGTISSQSGDHGEPVDPMNLERVEVVKGPATLLYGSNAIGGVVNVLTDHHVINQHPHQGLHMALTGTGGTANAQGGGSGSFEYGQGDWLFYGSGGGMRTGDYSTPAGRIANSFTEMTNAKAGIGRYGDRLSWNAVVHRIDMTYGVPGGHAHGEEDHGHEDMDAHGHGHELPVLDMRRTNARFNGALKRLGLFEQFQFDLGYADYTHREIEDGVTGTQFFNKQLVYSGMFDQRRRGPWSGRFGLWGLHRDYETRGAEALAPPVAQNAFALFGLEELSWERLRLQFGGRWETNRYSPEGLRQRRFSGASASAGAWIPLWRSGALVANYIRSYRAPALEELYNYGPHPGNLAYEIGNPDLVREAGDGVEISLRHQGRNLRAEANLFRYQMHDFVYYLPTGEVDHGLPVYLFSQADSRFAGAEARLQARVRGPLWLLAGFDYVDANLASGSRWNLPRIPPARGRLGLDWFWKGLSVRPELLLVNRQWQVAPNETPTAGYAVAHVNASYTLTRGHTLHTFNVTTFNLGNRLYRNHLSFVKDIAPEMGRGIRISYTLRLF
ncbi:MAG: TonB-dependent receptor [Bryobacteraceae bacterium]|nr:TonB-dependent receptor [Bryobacteraceae bacterium]